MNLMSSLQEDHGRGLRRKRAFNPSPTPVSPLSSLSLLSTSSISPVTSSDGEASATNISYNSEQSFGDVHHKNQRFSCKVEVDPNQRLFPDWTNESPIYPFLTSLCNPVLNSHPDNYIGSDPVLSANALSSDSTLFCSPENPAPTENLPMQIKSGCLVCCWKTCGKKFSNLKELAVHVNDDHVSIKCPDMDFQCRWQGCSRQGRGFNARYKMLIHIRTHTNEKPHTCVVCNKTFSRLENLKIHTRSHTGEKPYMCFFPGCGKAYSNSSDRFKHVRTHQEEKPYKCKMPGCRKQYTDPSSLRKHVRTHGHFGSTEVMLHRSFNSEVPKEEDGLKLKEDYNAKRHSVDAQTNFNNEHFCELNNKSSSDHSRKQKSNGHYNLDVQCDIPSSVGENIDLRKSLIECDISQETFCKTELAEDMVNSLNQFRVDDNKCSNLDRFIFSGDRLNNSDRFTFIEDKLNLSERLRCTEDKFTNSKRFRFAEDKFTNSDDCKFAEDRLNNLNSFTDAVETQKLFWQKQNIISEVLNNEIQELCSVTDDEGKNSHEKNVQISEKCNSLFDYCNEQSENKTGMEQQNKQPSVSDNQSKLWKHSGTSISDFSHKLESASPFSTHNCSESVSFHLTNSVGSECDKKAKCLSSPSTLDLSNQSSKTSHIEHWKKRKIMNREKELQTLLHSPSSLTQPAQSQRSHTPSSLIQQTPALKSHSTSSLPQPAQTLRSYSPSLSQLAQALRSHITPAFQNSQPCFENPATSSVSIIPNIPLTTSTQITDIPVLPSHVSTTPKLPTVTTTTKSTFVPPLSQPIQQSLPTVHPSHSFQTVDPTLYLTQPNALYPLLSSPNPRMYPPFFMPSLSSLTLSACSVIPLPAAYHLNSNTDRRSDFCPTYILPLEASLHHFKLQLPGAKEMWEHISPTYLQHVQDFADASVLSAANLGDFGFSYPDFPFHRSAFHQSCRTLFPLHLETQR